METSNSNESTTIWETWCYMIREGLIEWQRVTELLISNLKIVDEDLRDGIIQQTEQILSKRDQLQKEIHAPFTDEEEKLGEVLHKLEEKLHIHLKSFLNNIRKDISANHTKKASVQAYMNPYSNVFRDGTFYDKKK